MQGTHWVYNWLNNALSAFYPTHCFLCGDRAEGRWPLCQGCLDELPRNEQHCLRCAIPLSRGGVLCGRCSHVTSPVARSEIPLRYAPPLDFLVQQMKFQRQLALVRLLAGLVVDSVRQRDEPLPQLLLPVPMHRRRLRQRGYNQALELARELSRQLGVPLDWRSCRRTRHTAAQTSLQSRERQKNMRGAFSVKGSLPRHVAIVDDVVTTGSTVQEFARTLRRAGVERIEVWACARAGSEASRS